MNIKIELLLMDHATKTYTIDGMYMLLCIFELITEYGIKKLMV